MTIKELVAKYIEVRSKKEAFAKEYKAKVAKYDEALNKIEGLLLKNFDSSGMESVKTEMGTAFVSTRTSATVADRDAFMEFVFELGEAGKAFLENRVSKPAVEDFIAANEMPPPGVSVRVERTVNVRRPTAH
jgi:hypothetical protein